MHTQSYANAPGYTLIIIGLILSLISAFVPHFDAGYRLAPGVFFAGLLPYAVYGIAVPVEDTKQPAAQGKRQTAPIVGFSLE